MKNLYDKYNDEIYLEIVVTDDDAQMKKHAQYKPRG